MSKLDTKGPYRFELKTANSFTVEISENSTDADGKKLNYKLDEKYNLHVIQAPELAAPADKIKVYGRGIGGGWALIGILADTQDSEGFIEIKGGWWSALKVTGESLADDPANLYMISRIPDFSTGVLARSADGVL